MIRLTRRLTIKTLTNDRAKVDNFRNIVITKGSYHVEDINEFIQREMWQNGHYNFKANDKCYIDISANTNTLRSAMIIKDSYEVDFRRYNSINSLLGCHSKIYTSGFNESENMVNILTINGILVNIDIIQAVMLIVPHNLQFTCSFQMSLPGMESSKILMIFFTLQ